MEFKINACVKKVEYFKCSDCGSMVEKCNICKNNFYNSEELLCTDDCIHICDLCVERNGGKINGFD